MPHHLAPPSQTTASSCILASLRILIIYRALGRGLGSGPHTASGHCRPQWRYVSHTVYTKSSTSEPPGQFTLQQPGTSTHAAARGVAQNALVKITGDLYKSQSAATRGRQSRCFAHHAHALPRSQQQARVYAYGLAQPRRPTAPGQPSPPLEFGPTAQLQQRAAVPQPLQ